MNIVHGFTFLFFCTAFSKALTFISQLVLGCLMAPEEFGLYAIVISVGSFINVLRNGGIEQVLIKKGERFTEILPTALFQSFLFNILGMFFLLLSAYFITYVYQDDRLPKMLLIMSVVMPIGTAACFYRAKLSIDRKFKEISVQKTIGASARQLSLLLFALAGFGVYSFVLPMIVEVIAESVIGRFYTKWKPKFGAFDWNISKDLYSSSKWVMLGAFMLGLAMTGDFFFLGLFLPVDQLGMYFFGLQLVVAVGTTFSTAIQGVMLPALVHKVEDISDFRNLFSKALLQIFFVAMPIGVLLSMLSDPIIHLIWKGKWDDASIIAQILFACMPFWILVFLSRSSLEALGLWRKRLHYLANYGISSSLIAVLSAQTANIVFVALGVGLTRGLSGITQVFSIFRIIKQDYRSTLIQFVLIAVISFFSGFLSKFVMDALGPSSSDTLRFITTFFFFVLFFLLIARLTLPKQLMSILKIFKRR